MLTNLLLIVTSLLFVLIFLKLLGCAIIPVFYGNLTTIAERKNIASKKIDIILAAFNEEKVILDTVNNLLAIDYDYFILNIVDDGSTDATLQLLESNFKGNEKVKIISKANEGKAKALNHALVHSNAEIIVFVDADTHVKPDILSIVNLYFQEEGIGAISGHLEVRNTLNLLTFSQNVEYLTSLNLEREFLEKIDLFTTITGAICSFRRKDLLDVGCFKSDMVAEDCDVTFKFLKAGLKIKNAKDMVGYTEAPESMDMFMRQRVRWEFGLIQNLLKHYSFVKNKKDNLNLQIRFLLYYNWVYKIFFKILFVVADFVFLISLFTGFKSVHNYYLFFLSLESILCLFILFRELKIPAIRIVKFVFYRILYRHLLFISLLRAIIALSLGQNNIWKKITRYNSQFMKVRREQDSNG